MRGLNIVITILAVFMLILNIAQFIFWQNANKTTVEKYTADIANLQLQLDSFGNRVTVYTVNTAVKAGDEVTMNMFVPMDTYETLVTDQYIKDPLQYEGYFFKIAVNPGTPVLNNMFMSEELDVTVRDRDIYLDRMTVGIEAGDYVDIRMTFPYGDDYVVLPHKRIYAINENTVKMYLNEYEWNVYQGALVDYYLNKDYGCTLYADRYVEPGLQADAIPFYAVPTNIAALLQKNPNILDKVEAASLNVWRQQMEELLVLFRTEEDTIESDTGKLAGGRDSFNSGTEDDRKREDERKAEEEQRRQEAIANGTATEEDFWADTATGGY